MESTAEIHKTSFRFEHYTSTYIGTNSGRNKKRRRAVKFEEKNRSDKVILPECMREMEIRKKRRRWEKGTRKLYERNGMSKTEVEIVRRKGEVTERLREVQGQEQMSQIRVQQKV